MSVRSFDIDTESLSALPLLGMGTWGMGGTFERDTKNDDESIVALKRGLDLGITLIDTAQKYGDGHTEEIIGEAIRGYPREKLHIMTKVAKENLHYKAVLKAAEGSLKRLRTDYIDLYLIHWPNESIPLEETMSAMERLIDEQKVHFIGVSNFSLNQTIAASKYLRNTRLFVTQIEYNFLSRDPQKDIIPHAHAHDMRIIAARPYAKGHIAKTHNSLIKQLARKLGLSAYYPYAKGSLSENNILIIKKLAKKYGKTENQITLNWLISQGITVIPKATSTEHLEENIGALGWKLQEKDLILL